MSDSVGQYLNEIGARPAAHRRGGARALPDHREGPSPPVRASTPASAAPSSDEPSHRAAAGQGPVHPGQPAPGGERRPPLPAAPGHGAARPHPGGQPRPRARRRQVRLAQGLQVLDLRHLLDPPGHRPGPRPEGQPGPPARRPLRQPARRAAPGVAATATSSTTSTPASTASPPPPRSTAPSATTTPTSSSTCSPTTAPGPEAEVMAPTRGADGHRPARRPRRPCPLRRRAALRPQRRSQALLPRGRRGARRHRRGRPPPGQACGQRRARRAPATASPPPERPSAPGGSPSRLAVAIRTAFAPPRRRPATLEHRDETTWTPPSWRNLPAAQQPDWPDPGALEQIAQGALGAYPPLVFAGEARALTTPAGQVARRRGVPAPGRRLRRVLRRLLAPTRSATSSRSSSRWRSCSPTPRACRW